MKTKSIAIDGPSSAGKSTMAKELAKFLGYTYLDTGALYRAIAYYFLKNKINYKNISILTKVLDKIDIKLKFDNGVQKVFLCGEEITQNIRSNEVSMAASAVSAFPDVREFLLDLQRNMAKSNNVIMDGRDIGTVVLPNADLKIYLTASAEVRARRRFGELIRNKYDVTYEDILKTINERDYNDRNRKSAPLKPAEDSIIVDTTDYNFKDSLNILIKIVKEHIL